MKGWTFLYGRCPQGSAKVDGHGGDSADTGITYRSMLDPRARYSLLNSDSLPKSEVTNQRVEIEGVQRGRALWRAVRLKSAHNVSLN